MGRENKKKKVKLGQGTGEAASCVVNLMHLLFLAANTGGRMSDALMQHAACKNAAAALGALLFTPA
jgi:hypothetical protein